MSEHVTGYVSSNVEKIFGPNNVKTSQWHNRRRNTSAKVSEWTRTWLRGR